MTTKRKRKNILIVLIVMFLCTGSVGYVWYNQVSHVTVQKKIQFKRKALEPKKPLTEKVGELVWPWNSSYEIDEQGAKTQIDLCAEMGFKYVKIPLYLNYVVASKGVLRNNKYGDLLDYARSKGMTPIIRMWFAGTGGYQRKRYLLKGERLAKVVIHKFADQELIWESTNEPNQIVSWFSQDTSQNLDWAKFDDFVGKHLKSQNKHAIYIVGDLSGTTDESSAFLETVILKGYYKYADALSNHPYQKQTNAFNGQPEDGLNNNRASKYTAVLQKYKRRGLPLVTTEVGYSTEKTWTGQWNEQQQANYIARQVFILDMQHQPLIVLLALSDLQTSEGDKGWGLMKGPDYDHQTFKPSGVLLKNLLRQIKGYTYECRVKTGLGSKSSFALLYKANHKKKIVYWSTVSQQTLTCKVAGHSYELNAIETPQVANIN